MARVYISEFSGVASMPGGSAPVGAGVIRNQSVVVSSGSSQVGAAINGGTRLIRVHTDGIISIAIGPAASVVADINSFRMAANSTEYFAPNAGDSVAVITNT